MAASSQSGTSASGKKVWLSVLGVIVLLIALYTGGWFYATSVLKQNVLRALGEQQAAGMSGECTDMTLSGFPFSIGLSCSKVKVDDHGKGMSASFDNLNASAHVYAPGDIVWTLQSPAEFRTAQGLTVSSEWTLLQSSLKTKGKGIQQGSTVIEGLKAGVASSFTNQNIDFTAARTEIHVGQDGEDLHATVAVENSTTVIKDFPQVLPPMSASGDVVLTGKAGLLNGSDATGHALRGAAGVLNNLVADIGDGRTMTLSGPFSFDDQGFVSGQFKLQINALGPWRESLKTALPQAKHTIDLAGKLLKALASGGDSVSVDLAVDHGAVSLSGFIPLGSLPPI